MKFYWEINPEDLLKNGNYEKNNLSECAYNLMQKKGRNYNSLLIQKISKRI